MHIYANLHIYAKYVQNEKNMKHSFYSILTDKVGLWNSVGLLPFQISSSLRKQVLEIAHCRESEHC